MMAPPHVVIVGAGPAGLLLAILLSSLNIPTTLLDKSTVVDPWSSKSYTINLNPRGLSAMDHGGVLEDIKEAGIARNHFAIETADGDRKETPLSSPYYAFSRPDLVEVLEGILKTKHGECVTIQRGVRVTEVKEKEDGVELMLDDGSTMTCSHVVGADGKWSAVRNSHIEMKNAFTVQSEPCFGVSITPGSCPERWDRGGIIAFMPKETLKYYVIAAPLLSGSFSISAVFFDEIKEDHPWLVNPRDESMEVDWESEYGARTANSHANAEFESNLAKMLEKDLPKFYEDIQGSESLRTLRINRRVSWLKPLVDDPSYCSNSGRVALIGDAAHAMTPAIGEGCNCALESAVSLIAPLSKEKPVTADDVTEAFMAYGAKRPGEVMPIQMRSAKGNRYEVRLAASKK